VKTEWDYTHLAEAYLKRPDYSTEAVTRMLERAGITQAARVCDVGAGVAHLTLMLAQHGVAVVAVEPNEAMRRLGQQRTASLPLVQWHDGTGEETGQAAGAFDLVTFGSSFNVTNRQAALRESHRLLKPSGWFAALWNHRDLEDPLQRRLEKIIASFLPRYEYGSRRQDQTAEIDSSGLFGPVDRIEGQITHRQSRAEIVQAWRSHATLQRQAGTLFEEIIGTIAQVLAQEADDPVLVPYTTRIWMAPRR